MQDAYAYVLGKEKEERRRKYTFFNLWKIYSFWGLNIN